METRPTASDSGRIKTGSPETKVNRSGQSGVDQYWTPMVGQFPMPIDITLKQHYKTTSTPDATIGLRTEIIVVGIADRVARSRRTTQHPNSLTPGQRPGLTGRTEWGIMYTV